MNVAFYERRIPALAGSCGDRSCAATVGVPWKGRTQWSPPGPTNRPPPVTAAALDSAKRKPSWGETSSVLRRAKASSSCMAVAHLQLAVRFAEPPANTRMGKTGGRCPWRNSAPSRADFSSVRTPHLRTSFSRCFAHSARDISLLTASPATPLSAPSCTILSSDSPSTSRSQVCWSSHSMQYTVYKCSSHSMDPVCSMPPGAPGQKVNSTARI